MYKLTQYELLTTFRSPASWLTPLLFFIMTVCLFPFAFGSDEKILTTFAPCIIWIASLLAIMLSIGNLFQRDEQEGFLDVLLLSPIGIIQLALHKTVCHWLTNCLPLILITPLLALLLHLSVHQTTILVLTLLLGTPVLVLLGAIGSALILCTRGQSLLLPILIMPLYIPVLIFGTGTLIAAGNGSPLNGYFAILTALILMSLAFAPLLTGAALRIGANQ